MSIKLTEPCPTCNEPIGGHTVEDWLTHTNMGEADWDMDAPLTKLASPLGDITPCDHIDTRSLVTMAGQGLGPLGVVEMIWGIGKPNGKNRLVSKVHFIGKPDGMRKAGKLLQNAFNRSANAAETQMAADGQARRF